MEQVLIARFYGAPDTGATRYNTLFGGNECVVTTFNASQVVSTPGSITKLRVKLTEAPGDGKSWEFTVMKNGAPSDLTCTISGSDTTGTDAVNGVSVIATDTICLRCTPSGTPAAMYAEYTTIFTNVTTNESLILGSAITYELGTVYWPVSNSHIGDKQSSESLVKQICGASGTIANLYVQLDDDPGGGDRAYRFTLRKNGASTDLVVTISGGNDNGSDTTHEVSVSAGDDLSIMVEPLNSPSAAPNCLYGLSFESESSETLIPSGSAAYVTGAFNMLATGSIPSAWTDTEADRKQLAQETTLKNLYVALSEAPGTDESVVITVRKNGADTALAVTIEDDATSGNDTSSEVSVSDDDELDISAVLSDGAVATLLIRWGLVSLRTSGTVPSVQTDDATLVKQTSAQLNGTLTDDGGEPCYCGFDWGRTTNYGSYTGTVYGYETNDTFNASLSNLLPNTLYHFRAKAINSYGTVYGADKSFTTKSLIEDDDGEPEDMVKAQGFVSSIRRHFSKDAANSQGGVYTIELGLGGFGAGITSFTSPDRTDPTAIPGPDFYKTRLADVYSQLGAVLYGTGPTRPELREAYRVYEQLPALLYGIDIPTPSGEEMSPTIRDLHKYYPRFPTALWDTLRKRLSRLENMSPGVPATTDEAVLKTLFDAGTFIYATSDNTPAAKTDAQVMAILSGDAAAAFSMNSQKVTSLGHPAGDTDASTFRESVDAMLIGMC